MKHVLSFLTLAAVLAAPAAAADWEKQPGLYAVFATSKGEIVVRLYEDKAPFTVTNFVELAQGEKTFRDPRTGKVRRGKYYDGTKFHRVIPGFMIQGGDPTGTGGGGPGFSFNDEIDPSLKFERNGLLAMANAGIAQGAGGGRYGTNGAQFFITDSRGGRYPTHLNGKHAIFGEVVAGQPVVEAIADTNIQPGQGELKDAVDLKAVVIRRVAAAKKK